MRHTNELKEILQEYLPWNKARISCFTKMIIGLFVVRTVNLTEIACVLESESKYSSRYRRLQRFFSEFSIDYEGVSRLVFNLFCFGKNSFYISIDRTNWQWGKSDINILMLSIVYKGTAIPIIWKLLNKKGNSDTRERIELLQEFINSFGKHGIAGVLADREFIGREWFSWLEFERIPFYIRIKNNTITTNSRGLEVDIDGLFYDLKVNEERLLKGKRKIWGHDLYLTGLRLQDGELLIVATNSFPEQAIEIYGRRWEIETLFGCLKGRGFNFEDTHITDLERIKKMVALLTIAFSWAHKTGEWRHEKIEPIKIKKHGRPAQSLFRYGLDFIREAIIKAGVNIQLFRDCLRNICVPDYNSIESSLLYE